MLQEIVGSEQIVPCEVEEKVLKIMTENTKQTNDEGRKIVEGQEHRGRC